MIILIPIANRLGSPIKYLLELVNAPYKEEVYELADGKTDEWFVKKRNNLGLKFPNLPYIIDGDVRMTGKNCSLLIILYINSIINSFIYRFILEYVAIVRYLGRKHNLAPKTEQEKILSDQAESFISDIRFQFYRAAYNTDDYENAKAEFTEYARKKLPDLNKLYADNEYLLGSRMTYVDVLIYDLLVVLKVFDASLVNENANLARLVTTIDKLPNMIAYKNSSRWSKTPMSLCAPIASFKGRL